MTDDTTPITQPPTQPSPLFLSDEPTRIAAFIKQRQVMAQTTATEDGAPQPHPYSFADFVSEMNMTDFNDPYQIRATLESQAHLLGTAFQYLMMDGDWKNLRYILRTQHAMRETIELMNHYPPLAHLTLRDQDT